MNLNKIVAIMLMSTAVGMKETQLQLMVYGPQIAEAGFILGSYEGVTLQKVVKLDSPNYLLVYLDVDHNAQPGTLQFVFSNKKGKKTAVNYELKRREKVGSDRYGFDSKDVLYMLMPDRLPVERISRNLYLICCLMRWIAVSQPCVMEAIWKAYVSIWITSLI